MSVFHRIPGLKLVGAPFAPALQLQLERSSGSRDADMQLLRSVVDYVSSLCSDTFVYFCSASDINLTSNGDFSSTVKPQWVIVDVFSVVVFGKRRGRNPRSLPREGGALPPPTQVRLRLQSGCICSKSLGSFLIHLLIC